MDPAGLLLLIAGAACGGFVNGLAGFGTAMFALGFWLQVFPPVQAVAISVATSAITGLQGLWVVRYHILDQPRRLARFLLPALFGVPLGISALQMIQPGPLTFLISGAMIFYGLFFIARRSLPKFHRHTPVADSLVGLISGVLGGLSGLSGALPVMWCGLRPWTRQETRAVLQPFNVVILSLSTITLGFRGVYDMATLQALGIALVASIAAAQIGLFAFKRLTDLQFRWLLIGLMFLSGAGLMLRELI